MEEFNSVFMALSDAIAKKVIEQLQPLIESAKAAPSPRVDEKDVVHKGEVRGNNGLAKALKVSVGTVQGWKKSGILDPAIVCEYGRVIIYDLEKAKSCIGYKPLKPGRPKVC